MKRAVSRLLIAAILFGAAAVCWAEAARSRRVADAHQRLATLHYDAADAIDDGSMMTRVRVPMLSLDDEVQRHRARVGYWRTRTEKMPLNGASTTPLPSAPLPGARGGNTADDEVADPEVMLLATNTAFRAATREDTDRTKAVERLDTIIQAYAEVLRSAPSSDDAAFNYEYVVRLRDTIARGRGAVRGRRLADDELGMSVDLPAGPTIHGRPGGPPPEIPGDQFKTIAPMPYEEREETDPGQGPKPQRRG
jgi:hypothetical protein